MSRSGTSESRLEKKGCKTAKKENTLEKMENKRERKVSKLAM